MANSGLYILQFEEELRYIKVGYSSDLRTRLRHHERTYGPIRRRQIFTLNPVQASWAESYLMGEFKKLRTKKGFAEWYEGSFDQIVSLILHSLLKSESVLTELAAWNLGSPPSSYFKGYYRDHPELKKYL